MTEGTRWVSIVGDVRYVALNVYRHYTTCTICFQHVNPNRNEGRRTINEDKTLSYEHYACLLGLKVKPKPPQQWANPFTRPTDVIPFNHYRTATTCLLCRGHVNPTLPGYRVTTTGRQVTLQHDTCIATSPFATSRGNIRP